MALGTQHAIRMRSIFICGLPVSTVFFHIISQTALISKTKFTEHKMCVLIFSTTFSEIFLILRIIWRDIIINVYLSSCKVFVTCQNLMKLEFSRQCLKNTQISDFMKIRRVGSDLFLADVDRHTERQTHITKLLVDFRNFAKSA